MSYALLLTSPACRVVSSGNVFGTHVCRKKVNSPNAEMACI